MIFPPPEPENIWKAISRDLATLQSMLSEILGCSLAGTLLGYLFFRWVWHSYLCCVLGGALGLSYGTYRIYSKSVGKK